MSIKNIFLLALCWLSLGLNAQSDKQKFALLDLDTGLPIWQANFTYGPEQGVSDENGVIEFKYREGLDMNLSHVNYGSWKLSDSDIKKAVTEKILFRQSVSVNLYPVTVISIKPQSPQPEGRIQIAYQDRLEHDAADILSQNPAFNNIRKGGAYGFDPVFRGFKYDQLNVVLNGAQGATAACPNRMDPPTSQMAPNMMERIEILKGPHALRFGTGLGATINFIPGPLRFSGDPRLYGRVSTGYESNGQLMRGEGQLGLSTERMDWSAFASWSQGDDYTTGNGDKVQADFSRGSFGTQLGLKLTDQQQLRLSATYNRARDADFPALPMDLRDDDTWLFSARHDIQFNRAHLKGWNTNIFGSFVDHKMDNLLKPLDPRILNAETIARTYNYGGRTESNWRFGKHQMYAGADLRIEGAEGTRVREFLMGPMAGNRLEDNAWQEGSISKTGLFTEWHIRGSYFDYVLSGRLEINSARIDRAADEFTNVYAETNETQINPSISMGMLKAFDEKLQLGLWLARAQRSGSLTERFINYFPVGQDPFEMLGNPQLEPEVNYQADVNLRWQLGTNSLLNLDIYAAYLQDYISSVIDTGLTPRLPMSPGVRQFTNIDEAFKTGFELSWNQALMAGLSHRLGIAYTYGQDLQRDEPLPEIAPLDMRYTLAGSYLQHRLQPELHFRYVLEQSRVSNEFGETATPSFSLIDVNLRYQVNEQFSLTAGVQNLFDAHYYEHLNRSVRGSQAAIFAPGRNIMAKLNYTF
ncbi:MAG TPA: TonB-dependent receptor [Saprospiraceae bacterium]|nr:TonB-dependent receptor [Saprospiraceae bacterium]